MASSTLNTLWLLVLLSTFATADIDLNARYTVTNSLLGSNTLASTSLNSSLIVTSSASSSDSTWFFTSTSHDSYYRIHTVAKGSSNALDVDNYYGRNSIDMQFYWIDDEKSGQYWQINEQSDGSVKISNNFTGPDMFLGVEEGSLKPVLRAGDGEGSRWTLSSPGSTPTAAGVSSLAAPSATTMSTAVSTSGSGSGSAASSTPTSQVSSTSSSNDKKLSSGAIAGIAVGGVVGLALLAAGAFFLFRRKNDVDSEDELDKPPQMTTDPMINVRGGGS